MTLMVKVESQVCVRVDSHGVRVISQPVQVISKQLQSHRSSSLVASQTYFSSFPRRKKSWEIFYTFISIGLCTEHNRGWILQWRVIHVYFAAPMGHGLSLSCPVPRSGFVWGKKNPNPIINTIINPIETRFLLIYHNFWKEIVFKLRNLKKIAGS